MADGRLWLLRDAYTTETAWAPRHVGKELATGKRLAAPAGSFPVRHDRSRNRTQGRLQVSRPAGLRVWRLALRRRATSGC